MRKSFHIFREIHFNERILCGIVSDLETQNMPFINTILFGGNEMIASSESPFILAIILACKQLAYLWCVCIFCSSYLHFRWRFPSLSKQWNLSNMFAKLKPTSCTLCFYLSTLACEFQSTYSQIAFIYVFHCVSSCLRMRVAKVFSGTAHHSSILLGLQCDVIRLEFNNV